MCVCIYMGFPYGSDRKECCPMRKTQVRFLAWEEGEPEGEALEKEMATYFPTSLLAWEISLAEEPGGLVCGGHRRVRQDLVTNTPLTHTRTHTDTHTQPTASTQSLPKRTLQPPHRASGTTCFLSALEQFCPQSCKGRRRGG